VASESSRLLILTQHISSSGCLWPLPPADGGPRPHCCRVHSLWALGNGGGGGGARQVAFKHPSTEGTLFSGGVMDEADALEGTAHGGQIVVSAAALQQLGRLLGVAAATATAGPYQPAAAAPSAEASGQTHSLLGCLAWWLGYSRLSRSSASSSTGWSTTSDNFKDDGVLTLAERSASDLVLSMAGASLAPLAAAMRDLSYVELQHTAAALSACPFWLLDMVRSLAAWEPAT
jgi:hypothetical protein